MLHLLIISQLGHSLPVVSLAVVGFVGYSRKIVKAVLDFAIYVLDEVARVVKAYRRVKKEVQKDKEHKAARVRGRAPKVTQRRVTPADEKTIARQRRKTKAGK